MASNTLFGKILPDTEILEATFLLIVVFLVLSRAREFGAVVSSLGSAYTGGVKALQGR